MFSATLPVVDRLKPFLYGIVGLVFVFLVYKAYFSDGSTPPAPVPEAPASSGTMTASSSSSLNLIVRVSPLLRKEKTETSRSYLSPDKSPSPFPYELYTSDELIRGKAAVLFFASPDDPFSVEHHGLVTDLFNTAQLKVAVYRVDFATATGTKLAFGVIVPDTFVVLDANSERSGSFLHPTDTELRTLLTSPR